MSRRTPHPILALALGATLVALAACNNAPASSAAPSSAPSVAPASVAPSIAPSAPASAMASQTAAGGPLAEALVAKLAADPLVLHIEQVAKAETTVKGTYVTADVRLSGDMKGPDLYLSISGTSGGQGIDQELVVLGETAYVRTGNGAWTSSPRSAVAATLAALTKAIRLVDDPQDLREVGVETIDGQSLHHLTASGTIPYAPSSGGTGQYDVFDIWVLDDGTPVLAKTAFSATDAAGNKGTGTTDFTFSKFGGPIEIVAPSTGP